jgi:ribosomal protein S27AE
MREHIQMQNGHQRNGSRKDFSRIKTSLAIPNLIDVQRKSYERFLQMNLLPDERAGSGLQAVFTGIFPFSDFRETCSLDFVKYSIGDWQCKCGELKGLEYLRMSCSNCGAKIMTEHPHEETVTCGECGVVNKNRVTKCDICGNPVDLQLKYSIQDCQERGMTYAVPLKVTFRLFVYDKDPETGARMMRDAKEEEVYFGDIPLMTDNGTFVINGTERVIVSQLHRSPGVFFTKEGPRSYLAKIIPYRGSWVEFEYDQKDVLSVRIDRKRKFHGTVFLRALGLESDEQILRQFHTATQVRLEGQKAILSVTPKVLETERLKDRQSRGRRDSYPVFAGLTLDKDAIAKLDGGDNLLVEVGRGELERAMFIADVVDLESGEVVFDANTLVPEDAEERLPAVPSHRDNIKAGSTTSTPWPTAGSGTVGELMENQFRIGLVRMERAIKEKMSIHPDIDSAMPRDLINSKPVMAAVNEFFGSSQLSQFMDQTNPLSEVTHKRRLSALGPGGLSRERAGFEVRDVHSTHYGRICPIETPEGPNIGLISSLSCFARLNDMGFIESPYKKVENGRVLEHVEITQVGDGASSSARWSAATRLREDQRQAAQGQEGSRPGASPTPSTCRPGRRRTSTSPRPTPGSTTRATWSTTRSSPAPAASSWSSTATRSTTSTSRPAGGVGGGVAHPVPRARRRQPGPHGLQHAAPGGAPGSPRGADRRHRHGVGGRRGLGRGRRLPAGRRRRQGRQPADHRPRRGFDGEGSSAPTSTR